MSASFYQAPILNSPYELPSRHWELNESGHPTDNVLNERRPASLITPIPAPTKARQQRSLVFERKAAALERENQQYDLLTEINDLRRQIHLWRNLPSREWRVTPETARLLRHWRHHEFSGIRPFFCQVEAIETVIWLTEVAPSKGKAGRRFLDHLEMANDSANPGLPRLAVKLATGAGKTTVMAMLIAWQTVNAVRHPNSKRFTSGFLVVTPGITIRDRLRVLRPNDPGSYYAHRELVPRDMIDLLERAKIVITNFHAFKLRETHEMSKAGRAFLSGRGSEVRTLESEGLMLRRVMPELMGMKSIIVLNDEAHHCYREKLDKTEESDLKGDDQTEAKKNSESARLWISGLESIQRKLVLNRVIDFSATPFFLRGSGYAEGTLFPWTISDFSLFDAIEAGLVKLPRVPVSDYIPNSDIPKFRNLWEHIGTKLPKKGRGRAGTLDPNRLPIELQTALKVLYGHYEKTFDRWIEVGSEVPPSFIVVCNNSSTSKLVYDYISGFHRKNRDGSETLVNGKLTLFRNYDERGQPFGRPRTLLVDSEQLESGEALDASFRQAASDEIQRFRREIIERTGDLRQAENLSDQDLLREVMNTVGKPGRLGSDTRCVVSVAMVTEGWDASTVTHILGVRAFGTQLLCEQVIGQSLRRFSYQLNEMGVFNPEYADILGIPFDFAAQPVVPPPPPPPETVLVHAIRPERDKCEIAFPRVVGYRHEFPDECLSANFDADSTLSLTPELVGPSITRNEGIIAQGIDLDVKHLEGMRQSTVVHHLAQRLLARNWCDENGQPKHYLFGQLKSITQQWMDNHLVCESGTYPAQVLLWETLELACQRIQQAIESSFATKCPIRVILDPYNPIGSTRNVHFRSTRKVDHTATVVGRSLWRTSDRMCHVNYASCDSSWEAEFCRFVENDFLVRAYVKNEGLGFEVPYLFGSVPRLYRPDFILLLYDGKGEEDLLRVVVEVKGFRRENAKDKATTMRNYWIPGVNALGTFGRWTFLELGGTHEMGDGPDARVSLQIQYLDAMRVLLKDVHDAAASRLALAAGSQPDIEYIPRRRGEFYE